MSWLLLMWKKISNILTWKKGYDTNHSVKIIKKSNFVRTSRCLGDGSNPLSQWLLPTYCFTIALRERGNVFNNYLSLSQVSVERSVWVIKCKIVLFMNALKFWNWKVICFNFFHNTELLLIQLWGLFRWKRCFA